MTKFEHTMENIRCLIGRGGDGSKWFAYAYVSWYRSSGGHQVISLAGVERLDNTNIHLFWEMINLRRGRDWSEMALYELELYAIEQWHMNAIT
ncbi:hypothetical protein QN391_25315 [Pseudomonas sp. CCI1.2]|uniref:hypothetical protein n=1 Tax=Pseudomonas sp. CCI1.2 TaxID=3048614 RepID=UPI002B2287B9|nr:hypothetical protein [Pseudomonas sp. CCI1.2]MEB0123973.1 hypothetical protein [Pseudomonas sp. CCI1.2]